MDKTRRGYLLLALLSLIAIGAALSPTIPALTAYKSIAAGKALQITATQGWTKFGTTAYFTSYSRAATGGINDFFNLKVGGAYAMPRLGFCTDTAAVNMTVTSVAKWEIKYSATGAGSQRIWCPDKGQPDDVNGGLLSGWDSVNQVATITTGWAATVTVTWYAPASTPGTVSNSLREGVLIFASFLGIIFVLEALGKGDRMRALISAILTVVIPWLLALLIASMGF